MKILFADVPCGNYISSGLLYSLIKCYKGMNYLPILILKDEISLELEERHFH